ncbi:MAG: twin-arginine translocation signal domain-containing protein, partial [Bacteroidetes bacterium]
MTDTRRDFLKKAVAGTVGLTIGGRIMGTDARSYERISGSNDVLHIAIIGCNSRGASMAGTFARTTGAEVKFICDVDDIAIQKGIRAVKDVTG